MNSDLRRHVGQSSTENSSRDVDRPFREERRSSTISVWSHLSFREPSGVVRHSLKKIPILPAAVAFILVLVVVEFRFSSSSRFLAAAFVHRDITRPLTSR
jgi:hypothetical protein